MKKTLALGIATAMVLTGSMAFSGEMDFDMEGAKTLFEEKCNLCHPGDRALQKKKDFDGWKATVVRMAKKKEGHIGEEEAKTIIKYLTKVAGQ